MPLLAPVITAQEPSKRRLLSSTVIVNVPLVSNSS